MSIQNYYDNKLIINVDIDLNQSICDKKPTTKTPNVSISNEIINNKKCKLVSTSNQSVYFTPEQIKVVPTCIWKIAALVPNKVPLDDIEKISKKVINKSKTYKLKPKNLFIIKAYSDLNYIRDLIAATANYNSQLYRTTREEVEVGHFCSMTKKLINLASKVSVFNKLKNVLFFQGVDEAVTGLNNVNHTFSNCLHTNMEMTPYNAAISARKGGGILVYKLADKNILPLDVKEIREISDSSMIICPGSKMKAVTYISRENYFKNSQKIKKACKDYEELENGGRYLLIDQYVRWSFSFLFPSKLKNTIWSYLAEGILVDWLKIAQEK